MPYSSSIRRISSDTEAWATVSWAAAAVNEPVSAAARKARS